MLTALRTYLTDFVASCDRRRDSRRVLGDAFVYTSENEIKFSAPIATFWKRVISRRTDQHS